MENQIALLQKGIAEREQTITAIMTQKQMLDAELDKRGSQIAVQADEIHALSEHSAELEASVHELDAITREQAAELKELHQ